MKTETDYTYEDYETLHNTFAWFIRVACAEWTGADALTKETIDLMIDDYVAARADEEWEPLGTYDPSRQRD